MFDMLGGIGRKGVIWELNSLSDNQHPHRWIPEMPDFITLVYDSTKCEPLYFFCGGNHSYWPFTV